MNYRFRNQKITALFFLFILLIIGFLHLILPGKDISEDEGRKLARFPKLNYEDAKSGKQAANIEGWFSDQFPFRPLLIKAGKSWRSIVFPNLNSGGLQITPINHNLAVAEDPDEDIEIDNEEQPQPAVNIDPEAEQSNEQEIVNDPQTEENTTPVEETDANPTDNVSPMEENNPDDPPPLEDDDFRQTKVGIVITNNRAMEMYYGNEKKLKAYAERLNKLDSIFPENVQLYSMVIPTAIELYSPDQYHSGYSSQKDCINIVYDELNSTIKSVDSYTRLINNRDKYIYFRTDHHWTGLGAYYAYQSFAEVAGWTALSLDQMEHYQLEGTYLGSLYRATKESALKNNPDTTEGWKPVTGDYTATAWDKGDLKSSYNIRLNDPRSKGGNSYLNYSGGDRALLKIATSHNSGRKVLIIKDSFGNAFVPYLANHYDEVYVVDPRYYVKSLSSLVSENGITDVIVLNYMFGTSNKTWLGGFDKISN
ncbi:MAG TPA: hypothetical protein GXX72_03910 [Clostridiaceae bacterium]|nr:hypothetical protein [Clostridiaceae bacterium]